MRTADRLPALLSGVSLALLIFGGGMLVGHREWFPFPLFRLAWQGLAEIRGRAAHELPWYYRRLPPPLPPPIRRSDGAGQGVNLVQCMASGEQPAVLLLDMDGNEIHRWNIDWFTIWPDAKHVPERLKPRSRPGTHVHGAVLLENGDLVFSFEHLGLVRLDPAGRVVWRLPYQTHHTIRRHDDGTLWVCGQKEHTAPDPRFPNRVVPFAEYTVLQVTPDGQVVRDWSVADLLTANGRAGLLYLGSLDNWSTRTSGDPLHLNDVEPFPDSATEGFFKHGDVLVSLRNINTVFVFNRHSGAITYLSTGRFVRQHDADFIDGNSFSVFDNNNIGPEDNGQQSRIVVVSPADDSYRVAFEGTRGVTFYTPILGGHQWLPGGNLLLTESTRGRAVEVAPGGKVVWEYVNYVEEGVVGLVEGVQRLPEAAARPFRAGALPAAPAAR